MYVKHLGVLVVSVGVTAWFSGCDSIARRSECRCPECYQAAVQAEVPGPPADPRGPEQKPDENVAPERPPEPRAAGKMADANVPPVPAPEEPPTTTAATGGEGVEISSDAADILSDEAGDLLDETDMLEPGDDELPD